MKKIYCIVCPKSCVMTAEKKGEEYVITGNSCQRGYDFAVSEMEHPVRTICSLVRTDSEEKPVLPCRVSSDIPKEKIFDVMKEINKVCATKPIKVGDVLIKNVLNLGVDVIATDDLN